MGQKIEATLYKSLKCTCGFKAHMITNISNGTIKYTCGKPMKKSPTKLMKDKAIKNGTPYINDPNDPFGIKYLKPVRCKFSVIKKDPDFTGIFTFDDKNQNIESKTKNNEYFLLNHKIKYFITNNLLSTYKEIEELCNKLNISPFDDKKESLWEFCMRIKILSQEKL